MVRISCGRRDIRAMLSPRKQVWSLTIPGALPPETLTPDVRRVSIFGQQGLPVIRIGARDGKAVSNLNWACHFTLEAFTQSVVGAGLNVGFRLEAESALLFVEDGVIRDQF